MEDPPPLAEPPAKPREHPRDWFGMIVSLAAVTTSVVSIVIAVQNASSMDRLVQANSWPYLVLSSGNTTDGERVLSMRARNTGVGPLRLESLVVSHDGTDAGSFGELLRACCLPEGVELRTAQEFEANIGRALTSTPTGAVLAPGDDVLIFALPLEGANPEVWRKLDSVRFNALVVRACYCSVFDECWTTDFRSAKRENVVSCQPEEKSWRG